MRPILPYSPIVALLTVLLTAGAAADVRRVAYPRVKVEINEAYKPDPAFEAMRKSFAGAVARKDANAVFDLIAPGFVWTVGGALSGDYDPSRSALHHFKVLFGFREYGKDVDGGVADGPYWSSLTTFANEQTYYQTESGNLVCSPLAASVENEDTMEEARNKVETDDGAEWYFVLRDTPVARAVNDRGLPIARLNQEAVPILSVHPKAEEGKEAPTPTHFEVLLPSGRAGWIPAEAALPLDTGRLCYIAVPGGAWKIAIYDASE
jgi:hypothetical protein